MQITNIQIENIRGIEELDIRPGALTLISGANGQGKSSVLAAIQAVFNGGHDASLIRQGAKEGVVTITLSDGTTIRRRITEKSSTLTVTTPDGAVKKSPQTYVNELAGGMGLDPVSIITAEPKKRAKFLLENSRVTFQPQELTAATGQTINEALNLEGMTSLYKRIYEQRKEINGRAKEAGDTARALKETLPEDLDRDWVAELAEVEGLLVDRAAEEARMTAQASKEIEAQKAEVLRRAEESIAEIRRRAAEEINQIITDVNAQLASSTKDIATEITELSERKSTARAKADEQRRAKTIKEQIDAASKRYSSYSREADKLTKALEKLNALKESKIKADGIDGVEIVDGEIHVNGIPFEALNTASQYAIAFEIAGAGAGKLPLMIADRVECFDDAAWEDFCAAAKQSGFQVLAAKVDNHSLRVEVAA